MNYMFMPLRRYADFEGRSRRKEFWMWQLFNLIVMSLLIIPLIISFVAATARVNERGGITRTDSTQSSYDADAGFDSDISYGSSSSTQYKADPYMLMQELGPVPWILMGLALLWALIIFIPNLAVTIRRFHDQDKSGWFYLLAFIPFVGGLILLVFMFLEGTRGPNRFGPDPKGPDVSRTFA